MHYRWLIGFALALGLAACGDITASSPPSGQPVLATPLATTAQASPIPPSAALPTEAATPSETAPLTPVTTIVPAADIPSGSLLYVKFEESNLSIDVWLVRPAAIGGAQPPIRLTDCYNLNCVPTGFALSPDKTQFVYAATNNETLKATLYRRDLTSGQETVLREIDTTAITQIAFAPDGKRVAYLTSPNDPPPPIPTMTFNLLTLADNGARAISGAETFVEDLTWSADGASLLYSQGSSGAPQQWDVHQRPADGGDAKLVVNHGRLLSQSADGQRWLVHVEISSSRYGLGVYDQASGKLSQFETGTLIVYDAAWKADGTIAAIVSPAVSEPAKIAVFPSSAAAIPAPLDLGISSPLLVYWLGDSDYAAFVHSTPQGSAISTAQLSVGQPVGPTALVAPAIGYGLPLWIAVP